MKLDEMLKNNPDKEKILKVLGQDGKEDYITEDTHISYGTHDFSSCNADKKDIYKEIYKATEPIMIELVDAEKMLKELAKIAVRDRHHIQIILALLLNPKYTIRDMELITGLKKTAIADKIADIAILYPQFKIIVNANKCIERKSNRKTTRKRMNSDFNRRLQKLSEIESKQETFEDMFSWIL